MYDINSTVIALILFVSMLLAIEAGYRVGMLAQKQTNESSKTHVNAIQASLLGVLALLLGFTFSLALQRYDSRSTAIVEEANAIGTTYLRASLLDPGTQDQARDLLREYLALRIRASATSLESESGRDALLDDAREVQDRLWNLAVAAAQSDDRMTTSGLFIQSLNQMIDSLEVRNSAIDRHVPEIVLFLLYGTFLMTGVIVGYAAGISGHRANFITYIMVGLIVLLVFVIIDLDRPRRGLIEINQDSLEGLQTLMQQSR